VLLWQAASPQQVRSVALSPARLSHHLPASAGQPHRPRRSHRPSQHHLRRLNGHLYLLRRELNLPRCARPPSSPFFRSRGLQPAILRLPEVGVPRRRHRIWHPSALSDRRLPHTRVWRVGFLIFPSLDFPRSRRRL